MSFTVIVYVRFVPAVTGSALSLFVTDRSAEVSVLFVSEALLFVLPGSETPLETDALFVCAPVVADGTVI